MFVVLALITPINLFTDKLVKETYQDAQLIDVIEGINTTVSVHRQKTGNLILATSGIQVAGDQDDFRSTQKILGHLGILMNKNAKCALSIGFGSGESSSCLTKHALEQVDVVEISPEVIEISLKHFTHINLGKATADHVKITIMDAKNHLYLSDNKYDLIGTDSINPKQVAENASLYTKEYFQTALDHLNENGLVGCWLPIKELPTSCIDCVLGTFLEVFPHATLWFPVTVPSKYDFIYLVGSREQQFFSPKYIDTVLKSEEVRSSVAYINWSNSVDILSSYLGDEQDLKEYYLKAYEVNSDYHPFIEFNTDFTENVVFKKNWMKSFIRQSRVGSLMRHMDWTEMDSTDQEQWMFVQYWKM